MKVLNGRIGMAVLAVAIGISSCASETGETGTTVKVTTKDGRPDTVVRENTVVRNDTVVQERTNTVIEKKTDTVVRTVPGTKTPAPASRVSDDERRKIDAWLAANAGKMNQFGDSTGTMYAGSTPLYNEASGKAVDKYDYIVSRHPDKPWNNVSTPGTVGR